MFDKKPCDGFLQGDGMSAKRIVNILGAVDYFRGLSERSRSALAEVCRMRAVPRGEYLFYEGRRGAYMCVLATGRMQLVKTSEQGREIVIKTVEPGEIFAEVVLFERDTYPVSAMAVEPSEVVLLPKSGIRRLLSDSPFREEFVAHLMQRLRYLADRVLYMTTYDVEERFFRFLAEQYGMRQEYRIALSKKHIAAAIGTVPETLSRLKERLVSRGTLEWSGRTIRLQPGFWERRRV